MRSKYRDTMFICGESFDVCEDKLPQLLVICPIEGTDYTANYIHHTIYLAKIKELEDTISSLKK